MKTLLALFVFCTTSAFGQAPRPFVYGGLDLGNSAAGIAGAGVMENARHFLFSGEASYDTDGKSDQGYPGHNRRSKGSAYYKLSNGWFFGPNARWNELSTTGYSKQGWHLGTGFGKDARSYRLQVDYVLPASFVGAEHVSRSGCLVPNGQCTNNIQGPEFSFYIPSPTTKGHLFFRMVAGSFLGHTTITSTDPVLTARQRADRIMLGEVQLTIFYRF